jgi:hypothetical protein
MMGRFLPRAATCVAACLVLVVLSACGGSEEAGDIDVQVFPARLDNNPDDPVETGWRRVEFSGSGRTRAGTFLVTENSILTGWTSASPSSARTRPISRCPSP